MARGFQQSPGKLDRNSRLDSQLSKFAASLKGSETSWMLPLSEFRTSRQEFRYLRISSFQEVRGVKKKYEVNVTW